MCLIIGVACTDAGSNAAGTNATNGAAGAVAAAASTSKCTPEYAEFATGEQYGLHPTVRGTTLEARLLESEQAPPPRKGFNTWTIALRDAMTGEPASDASISWACAWMMVHEHGTNPKLVEPLGDGKFRLVKQNFAMTGEWLVRLWVDPTGKEPLYEPKTVSTLENGIACSPSEGLQGAANVEFKICVPDKF